MLITTQQIQIPVGHRSMGAFLAQPATGDQYPGVIIGAEIFGVTDYIRRVAERVAALGYTVIAPDFYHRTAPNVQLARDAAGRERGLALTAQLQRGEALDDVQASIQELTRRGAPSVGMLGFSLGGHLAYLAAAQLPLKATAVLYGGWIPSTDWAFTQPEPTLELTVGLAQQGGFLLFLVGEEDRVVPPEHQAQIQQKLVQEGVRHEFVVYPDTPHGFFSDDADSFQQAAHDDAWNRIRTMLERELA